MHANAIQDQKRTIAGIPICVFVCVFIYRHTRDNRHLPLPSVRMMMVSDDCLVECKIDDDSDEDNGGEEQINTPPPPPEFASKAPTPAPKPPTPPTAPATPTPTCPVNRDPYGINQHLKVFFPFSSLYEPTLSVLGLASVVNSFLMYIHVLYIYTLLI